MGKKIYAVKLDFGKEKERIYQVFQELLQMFQNVPKKNPSYVAYEGFFMLIAPSPVSELSEITI
jgi:hypothetical protein